MPRDDWRYRSWGEQLVRGLLAVVAVAVLAQVVADILAPLIVPTIGALILLAAFGGMWGRRDRW